jgi:hypothetical protein
MTAPPALARENLLRRLYAAMILLHVALVWALPYFPSQDGPSHVYNLVILKELLQGDAIWAQYFTHDLRATPNLGFHIIAYPLLWLFPPLVVEKLFLSIYILLMTLGVPWLLKSFGAKVLPVSFLVFPLLFNYALMMGFYSFSLAVACMVMAMAWTWSERHAPLPRRALVWNCCAIVLYFLHLIPFAIYLLFLVIMAVVLTKDFRSGCRNLLEVLFLNCPSIILCGLFLLGSNSSQTVLTVYNFSLSRLTSLGLDLLLFSLDTFSPLQLIPWAVLATMLGALHIGVRSGKTSSPVDRETKQCIGWLLAALTLVYFIAPDNFAGGCLFNPRLPWIILLLALPLLPAPENGRIATVFRTILPGIALLYLISNGLVMYRENLNVREFLHGITAPIAPGSLLAAYKEPKPSWSRIDPLLHVASYYGLEKKAIDAGNYEAVTTLFPVRFRTDGPKRPGIGQIEINVKKIDWKDYPAIDYLLGWEVPAEKRSHLQEHYALIMEHRRFTLWQRIAIRRN